MGNGGVKLLLVRNILSVVVRLMKKRSQVMPQAVKASIISCLAKAGESKIKFA